MTNQKTGQESFSSLASMLGVNKDQEIIKVNNNMQTLVMAKEQYGYSEGRETPGGGSQPKWQNFPLIMPVALNKP